MAALARAGVDRLSEKKRLQRQDVTAARRHDTGSSAMSIDDWWFTLDFG
jgi:hypothetical protein